MGKNCWAIVLAGGEGVRMWGVAKDWRGQFCPKQYCAFVGSRTMLEHTLDRAREVVSPEQIVTVIGRGHRAYLGPNHARIPGRIVEQPLSRGTFAGVFLAATYILAVDPSATLLVLPSDHFVHPESCFIEDLLRLLVTAELLPDRLVLLGARAEAPEPEYGWLEPGQAVPGATSPLRTLASFREKPSCFEARHYFSRSFLWNTMVVAAKGATLWDIGEEQLPRVVNRFSALQEVLRASYVGEVSRSLDGIEVLASLGRLYNDFPTADFSSGLLQAATSRSVVMEMDPRVEWSDWGRPERIEQSLTRLGLAPRLPLSRSNRREAASGERVEAVAG